MKGLEAWKRIGIPEDREAGKKLNKAGDLTRNGSGQNRWEESSSASEGTKLYPRIAEGL